MYKDMIPHIQSQPKFFCHILCTHVHNYNHVLFILYVRQGLYLIMSPYSMVLLDKLMITQFEKKLSTGSLLHAQEHTVRPCTKPPESSHNLHPLLSRLLWTLSSHLCPGLTNSLFHLCVPTEKMYVPLIYLIHATCPNSPIHFMFEEYQLQST